MKIIHKIPIEITPTYIPFSKCIDKLIFQKDLQELANKIGIGNKTYNNKK